MLNKRVAEHMILNMLYERMLCGEIIAIEYGNKKKMKEARRYFPDTLGSVFSDSEIIDVIQWAMGVIHKEISEAGKGEVLMVHGLSCKKIIYRMYMYGN